MIILDTNVISEVIRPAGSPLVVQWLDLQTVTDVFTTAVTVFELRSGLLSLPAGRKKVHLLKVFEEVITVGMRERVLDVDWSAASQAAEIASRLRRQGVTIEIRDILIAGVAADHSATLATRNTRHFAKTGVRLVNPWEHGAH